jgi:hypothetical protein
MLSDDIGEQQGSLSKVEQELRIGVDDLLSNHIVEQ